MEGSAIFSGIVEQKAKVFALTENADGRRLTISLNEPMADLKLGDSINVSGCCLTVTDLQKDSFTVEAMHETLRRSRIGLLKTGNTVNLERALKLSDRLGGHLVAGHVDAMAKVVSIKEEGFSSLVTFSMASQYAPYFIEKGSVTIDGVSLTVVNCDDNDLAEGQFQFSVALIPYTKENTTLGNLQIGDVVNIETDLVAKYLRRWHSLSGQFSLDINSEAKELVNKT